MFERFNHLPGHLIRRLQQIAVAVFHAEVGAAGFDLTPVQFAALAQIDDKPGVDQATLASLIAYDRATIGGVVERLVQKELVTREVSELDRRARVLHVTDQGQDVLKRIRPAVDKAQELMLSGLDETEARTFMELLTKATLSMNAHSRAPKKDI